jgi:cephalosporin hydroxylase
MKITIDTDANTVEVCDECGARLVPLSSPEGFSIASKAWLRAGWDNKYVYSFTWLGRPIIQLPEDLLRIQEVIYRLHPDVIIETGIAHGGSLVYYASLCQLMKHGKVIGVDIEIRHHNRQAIESHKLKPYITLIEGSSIDPQIVSQVQSLVRPGETVLVILDSCHMKEHVLSELRAYAPLVSIGSYIITADGIMEQVIGAPRTQPDWSWNNPKQAAMEFVRNNSEFIIEEPTFLFNEGSITRWVTYWPDGFIKRIKLP